MVLKITTVRIWPYFAFFYIYNFVNFDNFIYMKLCSLLILAKN